MATELSQRASQPSCAPVSDASPARWKRPTVVSGSHAQASTSTRLGRVVPSKLRQMLTALALGACLLLVVGVALGAIAYLAHRINTTWLIL